MRIQRTEAIRILNSKAVYSRARILRLVSVDTTEEETLGDTDELLAEEVG